MTCSPACELCHRPGFLRACRYTGEYSGKLQFIALSSKSVILSEHMASRRIFALKYCKKASVMRRFFDSAHSAPLRMTCSVVRSATR